MSGMSFMMFMSGRGRRREREWMVCGDACTVRMRNLRECPESLELVYMVSHQRKCVLYIGVPCDLIKFPSFPSNNAPNASNQIWVS